MNKLQQFTVRPQCYIFQGQYWTIHCSHTHTGRLPDSFSDRKTPFLLNSLFSFVYLTCLHTVIQTIELGISDCSPKIHLKGRSFRWIVFASALLLPFYFNPSILWTVRSWMCTGFKQVFCLIHVLKRDETQWSGTSWLAHTPESQRSLMLIIPASAGHCRGAPTSPSASAPHLLLHTGHNSPANTEESHCIYE